MSHFDEKRVTGLSIIAAMVHRMYCDPELPNLITLDSISKAPNKGDSDGNQTFDKGCKHDDTKVLSRAYT